MNKKNKVLFILKRREDYNGFSHSQDGLSTGLYNSASFMKDMLIENRIEAKLVVVVDNNDIDREVTKYKPTHVIIEALWVVPSKFAVLHKLHPTVKWIVRLHSELPFIANEGMAMNWIAGYMKHDNVFLGVNAPRAFEEVKYYIKDVMNWKHNEIDERIIYLPNYYPQDYVTKKFDRSKEFINIGCFGAIRPLKNHLVQAIAAIKFADKIDKKLNFHVNSGRVEMKGEPVYHNLKHMFENLSDKGHSLVVNEWTPREGFIKLCASMDIGLQVSFSETFNIVGADLVSQGVPLVGSSEIPWSSSLFNARATESEEIYNSLINTYKYPQVNVFFNQWNLTTYTSKTEKIWVNYFK